MLDFLQYIILYLQQYNINYMLSGSVALSIYVVPRATRDFDFVIHLRHEDAESLANHFKEGYYCDLDSIKEAIKRKGMFNIIDHASGFKADFVILKNTPFRQEEFSRKIKVDFDGLPIWVVTAEDLLLSKLIWIQDVQSSLQKEDIKMLSELQNLNWEYIHSWIKQLNLNTFDIVRL